MIVGLDIGTSNVRAVIAEFDDENVLQVLGVGECSSTGLRSGVIVNIDATMRSVTQAIEQAEMMAGREVSAVVTGIGGNQVESINSKGIVGVTAKGKNNHEIKKEDVHRVIEAARAINFPTGKEILHIIRQSYIVDGQTGIKDPINMIGVRLEVEAHIMTAVSSSAMNFNKCIERAGYSVQGIKSKTLAQSISVVTQEERELGSILIDLGGGSTDILVLIGGAPIYATSIPVGGIMVTTDISKVRGISIETAENIKLKYGCCFEELLDEYEEVIIPGVGGRPPEVISRNEICQIIEPRMEEIFNMIREKIAQQTKLKQLSGNIILTGGGALMEGATELAGKVFDTSCVRVGTPLNLGGQVDIYKKPTFATVIGLVSSTADDIKLKYGATSNDNKHKKIKGNLKNSVITFFKEFF